MKPFRDGEKKERGGAQKKKRNLKQDDFSGLLFNLASEDRLTLLSEINSEKHPRRLADLSKIINASAQECSRHSARLSDSGFIAKDSSGEYRTMPLGGTRSSVSCRVCASS